MAALHKLNNGSWRIQFTLEHRRRSLYLGKCRKRDAEEIKHRVEDLVDSVKYSQPVSATATDWLNNVSTEFYAKLVAVGLVGVRTTHTIQGLIDYCLDVLRVRNKPTTLKQYEQAARNLLEFADPTLPIAGVTPDDAEEFYAWMNRKGLAISTVSRRTKRIREFFGTATRNGWIDVNPFDRLKLPQEVNSKRLFFVRHETVSELLSVVQDPEYRLILCLARYGGLRCPSEILQLKWDWVNWEKESLLVYAPKHEKQPHRTWRLTPLWPQLQPAFNDAWEAAEPGATHVISRHRTSGQNWGKILRRKCEIAKIPVWPKFFQNMRSTRQTELSEVFPEYLVCYWLGNSRPIARRHYLQVTDEHNAAAIRTEMSRLSPSEGVTTSCQSSDDLKNDSPVARQGFSETVTNPKTPWKNMPK